MIRHPRLRVGGFTLVLVACSAQPPEAHDEQAVLGAVLQKVLADTESRRLVVRPTFIPALAVLGGVSERGDIDTAAARRYLESRGLRSELAHALASANVSPDSVPLPALPELPVAVDTLPPIADDALRDSLRRYGASGAGFEYWQRSYPGAQVLVGLSRVGFTPSAEQAVVYVMSFCGLLCGGGSLYVLERDSGRWQVSQELVLWVS